MRLARPLAACLAVVVGLVLGACGGEGGDEERIREIIVEVAEDPAAICAHLPSEVVDAVGGLQQCDALAVHGEGGGGERIAIDEVEVDGDIATATVTDGGGTEERIAFVREGDDWKVDDPAGE